MMLETFKLNELTEKKGSIVKKTECGFVGRVVLVHLKTNNVTPWVTWFQNAYDGAHYHGDYCSTLSDAEESFAKRADRLKHEIDQRNEPAPHPSE
jgi:hypothetical protein